MPISDISLLSNIASADSTGQIPGADGYRCKIPTFKAKVDRAFGAEVVGPRKVRTGRSSFRRVYEPSHPPADQNAHVNYPNANAPVARWPTCVMRSVRLRPISTSLLRRGACSSARLRSSIPDPERQHDAAARRRRQCLRQTRQARGTGSGISPGGRRRARGAELRRAGEEVLGAATRPATKSDVQARSPAGGKAGMIDLVMAVSESQTAIVTPVSVPDRVIQTCQQIMQMPI